MDYNLIFLVFLRGSTGLALRFFSTEMRAGVGEGVGKSRVGGSSVNEGVGSRVDSVLKGQSGVETD